MKIKMVNIYVLVEIEWSLTFCEIPKVLQLTLFLVLGCLNWEDVILIW